MAAKRKSRLAAVSRIQGQPRIRALHCFKEVHQRIVDGWPLPKVAEYIQQGRGELKDMSRAQIVAQLVGYRETIPPAELVKTRIPDKHMQAVEKVAEGLDELGELEKLYRLQMERVEIDFKHERNIKKLMPTLGQEVRIARELLATYAELKMDLGLSKRHLGQVDVEARLLADVAHRYNKPEVQEVMDDPLSRKKVLSLVEKMMSKPAMALLPDTIDVEAEEVRTDAPAPVAVAVEPTLAPAPEPESEPDERAPIGGLHDGEEDEEECEL